MFVVGNCNVKFSFVMLLCLYNDQYCCSIILLTCIELFFAYFSFLDLSLRGPLCYEHSALSWQNDRPC